MPKIYKKPSSSRMRKRDKERLRSTRNLDYLDVPNLQEAQLFKVEKERQRKTEIYKESGLPGCPKCTRRSDLLG